MAKPKQKKSKQKKESNLLYIPFAVLIAVIVILVVFPYIHASKNSVSVANANTPLFNIYKVSNQNFAGNNSVQIYFISWYGCPNGATSSWPLYLALEHFGNVSVKTNYSIYESDLGARIPGLIFTNYTPYNTKALPVYFHPIYIYGHYLNETTNGTPIPTNDIVSFGLQELKELVPSWVYNLTVFYEINSTYNINGNMINVINAGNPPHIVTLTIISGPGGTWVDIGYPNNISPTQLAGLNSTLLYQYITGKSTPSGIYANVYKSIYDSYQMLYNTIREAML